ncbi:GNAT family N-acetyltransferase [Vibrio sp. SCSIO 43135]|uniref:GNAT family N-acetyltransferase n=1 Tax=Vibrio sp. SCSIO 43135 TaxID=2819096 RepID=UPI0020757E38|nr:GNAT family N-acetyltransferase [Vibrio sp. SCSIO 43135]USD42681.1 GNAT family N-acetyltransferase [Vibrio sp. SCSIO 43135]
MELIPFEPKDYPLLIDWIPSAEFNYQWGGPAYQYPLTIEQITRHCDDDTIFPYLFKVRGVIAGYIELRKINSTTCRLCRVLILDSHQGLGLSKSMLSLAILKAKSDHQCTALTLCVFEHNAVAISLYTSLGFSVTSVKTGEQEVCGRHWTGVEMVASIAASARLAQQVMS